MRTLGLFVAAGVVLTAGSALASDFKTPECGVLSELPPDDIGIAANHPDDERMIELFGKAVNKFSIEELEAIRTKYQTCNKQSTLNWATDYSDEFFNTRINEAFAEVTTVIAENSSLADTKRFAADIIKRAKVVKSEGGFAVSDLKREVEKRRNETTDAEQRIILSDTLDEIDAIVKETADAAVSTPQPDQGSGVDLSKMTVEQRLDSPAMTQWFVSTYLMKLQHYCAQYEVLLAEDEFETLVERQEELWAHLALPEELKPKIVEKADREIEAGLANIKPRDCRTGNADIQNLLATVYAKE